MDRFEWGVVGVKLVFIGFVIIVVWLIIDAMKI